MKTNDPLLKVVLWHFGGAGQFVAGMITGAAKKAGEAIEKCKESNKRK